MSSIMRWRSELMGFSSIAKTSVSHGVDPHDLETVRTFAFVFSSPKLPASPRRNYRASGFVHTSTPVIRHIQQAPRLLLALCRRLQAPYRRSHARYRGRSRSGSPSDPL